MRLCYSLRTLFIVVTLFCFAIGWLALPTLRAHAFVAAMARKDHAAAQKLFIHPQEVSPGRWKEHQIFEPRVMLKPLTWRDLIHRERQIIVGVSYCDGGIASCTIEIKATADGLEKGMVLP